MKLGIDKFNPCSAGREYYNKCASFAEAWANCERGDWMLWLAVKLKIDLRLLTLAKGKCAETVIHLMKNERSKKAVEIAIAYGKGNATLDELHTAYAAADAAAYAAADAADAYAAADAADAAAAAAAYAATYAAYAAADAADASNAAADDAAAYAAYAAADASNAARLENQKKTANICRELLTDAINKLIRGK